MTKDEIKEYHRNYYESHKEKLNEKCKKYYESHKEEMKEYNKEIYNKRTNSLINIFQVYRYFQRNYSRYISLENYIAIMKMNNYSSKHSIMTRLGHGLIDEDEAVALSGMTLSDEEKNELINIFNILNIKRK